MLTEESLPSCARTLLTYWSLTTPKFPVVTPKPLPPTPPPAPIPTPTPSVSEKDFNDLKLAYTNLQQQAVAQKTRLAELEREKASAQGRDQDRIKELEKNNLELQQEVKKQQEQSLQILPEVAAWQRRFNDVSKERDELFAELGRVSEDCKATIKQWRDDFIGVNIESDELDAKIKELTKQNEHLELQLKQLQDTEVKTRQQSAEELKARYAEELKELENRNRQSREQWLATERKLKDDLQQANTQLERALGQNQALQQRIQLDAAMQTSNLKVKETNAKLEEEIAGLQRQLIKQEASALKFQQDCKNQYQYVVNERDQLRQQLDDLKLASEKRETTLSEEISKSSDTQVENLQAGLEAQRREFERARQQDKNALFTATQSLATTQTQLQETKTLFNQLAGTLTAERKRSQEIQAEAYAKQGALTKQLSELNGKLQTELQQKQTMTRQLEELKQTLDRQARAYEKEREQLTNEVTKISEDNAAKFKQAENLTRGIADQNRALLAQLEAYNLERQASQQRIQELESANTTYTEEQETLTKQIQDLKATNRSVKAAQDQLSRCQVNLQQAKGEIEKGSNELKNVTASYEDRLAQATAQKERQAQDCQTQVQQALEVAGEECKKLQQDNDDEIERLNVENDELGKAFKEKDTKNRELNQTVKELRDRADINGRAVDDLNELVTSKDLALQACQERLQRTFPPST